MLNLSIIWLQFRANFADRYIEMRMRRVHLSMGTEGIKASSMRIRRTALKCERRKRYENDKRGRKSFWKRSKNCSVFVWKRISVDRALFLRDKAETKQLKFLL